MDLENKTCPHCNGTGIIHPDINTPEYCYHCTELKSELVKAYNILNLSKDFITDKITELGKIMGTS